MDETKPIPIREWLDRVSDERFNNDESNGLLVMDGFDDCIVGICHRFNDSFVVYDRQKVIAKLMADGMSEEEAVEFHDFNQLGAWNGEHTPGFIETPDDNEGQTDGTD
jgi:hypothetical protein